MTRVVEGGSEIGLRLCSLLKNLMQIAPLEIETNNLILRIIEGADRDEIFSAYGSNHLVARYMTWPVAKKPTDIEEFVQSAVVGFKNGTGYEYVVRAKTTANIIGGCGMQRHTTTSDNHFVFGYCFSPTVWGNGYATEVSRALVEWFKATPSVYRLAAHVDIDNPASCRVLEKAGLGREGTLRRWIVHPNLGPEPRDVVMYSVVK